MKFRTIWFLSFVVTAAPALAEGDYPWLAIPGKFSVGVSYTNQSGDKFYAGSKEMSFMKPFELKTTIVHASYGWSDFLAADVILGTSSSKVVLPDAMLAESSGRTDTLVGVKWRIIDEFMAESSPTITLRAAAILKGDYEAEIPAGIGKGANGFELAVTTGKQFGPALSLSAELGAQKRSNDVPNAIFFGATADWMFAKSWSVYAGLTRKSYSGGLDIMGPGFSPSRFDEVAEERTLVKSGLTYFLQDNQSLSLHFSKLQAGRNTVADDSILSFSYNISF